MNRGNGAIVGAGALAILVATCFGGALAGGRQFAFRDAGHFYGPLERRVQQEWAAGRLPLWEPEENAGIPLLGNPTAAVLYPGKLVFALLPFEWAMRAYLIGHVLLAVAAMGALLRTFGASPAGALIGGLAYGFGGPVLFQYGNEIFLVGAAWLPLAFRATDRWVRQGKRLGVAELAAVLTLQVLGGDPQAAYLAALGAAAYAWFAGRPRREGPTTAGRSGAILIGIGVVGWVGATLAIAAIWPTVRMRLGVKGPAPIPWPSGAVLWGAWGLAGVVVLARWRRGGWSSPRARGMFGVVGACALAGLLAAVQLLPSAEFTARSARAADVGPHDIYPFSLEPYRAVELLWPGAFGENLRANRWWLDRLLPAGRHKMWVPSLYLGGLTLVLALAALGGRGEADRRPRRWMAWVALLGLWASCGEYGGPLRWAREVPGATALVGPHDPPDAPTVRDDGFPRDGDGSPYWLLATALPVFSSFRYPSKLLVLASLGLAGLAGLGWDDATSGRSRRARRLAIAGAMASLFLLLMTYVFQAHILRLLGSGPPIPHVFGPFDAPGALADLRRALLQGAIATGVAYLSIRLATRPMKSRRLGLDPADNSGPHPGPLPGGESRGLGHDPADNSPSETGGPGCSQPGSRSDERSRENEPGAPPGPRAAPPPRLRATGATRYTGASSSRVGFAAAIAVLALAIDLALANARDVITVPQSLLDARPKLLEIIEADARGHRWPGPYRVHRMTPWEPIGWFRAGVPSYDAEVAWEHDTLMPKYGIRYGMQYTFTEGTAEYYDYQWFVNPFTMPRWMARALKLPVGTPAVYYPRNGFDLWGTRYFVLPAAATLSQVSRATAWFRDRADEIARDDEADWVVVRNRDAFPRAWALHAVKLRPPIVGMSRDDRQAFMRELLEPRESAPLPDFRAVAYVEADDVGPLAPLVPGSPADPADVVTIARYEPTRVEIRATLGRPGLVVLADVFYPGWTLTLDGRPATIYRTNRAMRGALVGGGPHTLVYEYRPRSFRVGLGATVAGGVALLLTLAWALRRGPPAL